jgi:hypothetical protein
VESSLMPHFKEIDQLESNFKNFLGLEQTESNFGFFPQDLMEILEVSLFRLERSDSEEEFVKNREDIKGILQVLNMFTQHIEIDLKSVKENIQLSFEESLEIIDYKFTILIILIIFFKHFD